MTQHIIHGGTTVGGSKVTPGQHTEHHDFGEPHEVRIFEFGRAEILQVGESEIGRLTLQPGWRWSDHVKPIAGTEWCEAPHFQYHVRDAAHDGRRHRVRRGARPG